MKPLLLGIAALLLGLPSHAQTAPVESEAISAQSETVYLLISLEGTEVLTKSSAIAMHSLPMKSAAQCELAGAHLISSKRLMPNTTRLIKVVGFECIEGK